MKSESGNMRNEPVNSTFFLYNTVCSITIYDDCEDAVKILEGARDIAFHIRRMLDFYDPCSELGKLNERHETGVPYKVSKELCLFISELLRFSDLSEGCFDPTVGPVVRLWNITALEPKAPTKHEIEDARAKTGAAYVSCDITNNTITFEKEGMVIDAGGAGKGYAAGCVSEYLKAQGIKSASVNFGGNLYLIGPKTLPDGTKVSWKVGIQTPWKANPECMGFLTLQDCGTATSGGYDRYFTINEKIYHHLLDPRSGYPADYDLDSVTIVSESALYTDLLSTACFVGGEEMAMRICRKAGKAGYVLIRKDGKVLVSGNLEHCFKIN